MKRLLRFLLLAAVLAGVAHAAELIGDIPLKTGKVLHHAKLISDQFDSLVVFSAEGMVKVRKADLPDALAKRYPERAAPPPPPAPLISKPLTLDAPDEAGRPRPAPPPVAAPADPNLFRGCLITNFAAKPVQGTLGCVEVTIHNSTESPVDITPAMIRCVTTDGKVHPGMRFFVVNDLGSMTMKKTETVPPSGDVTDVVFFQQLEMDIQSLSWATKS